MFAPYHGVQPVWKTLNSWPWGTAGSHCSVWFACGSSRRSVVKTPVLSTLTVPTVGYDGARVAVVAVEPAPTGRWLSKGAPGRR